MHRAGACGLLSPTSLAGTCASLYTDGPPGLRLSSRTAPGARPTVEALTGVRFVTVEQEGRRFAGALIEDHVVPLEGIAELGLQTPNSVLTDPPLEPNRAVLAEGVRFLPPVPTPGKILCVGLNYKTHVHETGRELPTYPVLFTKFASSLVGAFDSITCPAESTQVDFEGEMAVVIGDHARRVPVDRALGVAAGYTVANDVTMRDYQYRTHQWIQGKAWDRSTPIGPAVVTRDEVGDTPNLDIEVRLNGEVMQSANTSKLIFDVATLISTVSEFTALRPGDIILTGTPGGVGFRRSPQVFLTAGDVVTVELVGVGKLENPVTKEE